MPKVKTESYQIMQPDQNKELTVVPVHVDSKTERFSMEVPAHIAEAIGEDPDVPIHSVERFRMGYIRGVEAETAPEVRRQFEAVLRAYEKHIIEVKMTKVIVVDFDAGVHTEDGVDVEGNTRWLNLGAANWGNKPQLHLNYQIFYLSGTKLYRRSEWTIGLKEGEEPRITHQYHKDAEGEVCVEWTEEREAFFRGSVDGLTQLIVVIHKFLEKVKEDPDSIDQIIARMPPLLTGPGKS